MGDARDAGQVGSRSIVGSARTAARTAARAAAPEADTFSPLVDRHYAPLLRYLTRLTGDGELAADLTQTSFLAAYRNRRQLESADAFAGWLYQIARNEVRMEWRRRRLRRWVSLDWVPGPAAARPEALWRPDASGPCQQRDLIQRVLDELSPPMREALLLHGLCGFTGREVASILGITPAAARKRIARAEDAFRRRYGEEDGGHDDGD